jgi:hypothetical protein
MRVYCHQPEPLVHGPVSSSERFDAERRIVKFTTASIVTDDRV